MLVKQSRELGIKAQLMGTDDMGNEQFFNLAGDTAEGAYLYWSKGRKKTNHWNMRRTTRRNWD